VAVRSLGYRTDLAILALEGSQVTDRGDHLVIRTPDNPDYWWGNFLLLRDLKPGSGGSWLARFAVEFPDAQYIALGLDQTDAGTVDPGDLAGFLTARLAGTLVWQVGAAALAGHTRTLVMVADPAGDAIRVYRGIIV
jgi:hypothetical protein